MALGLELWLFSRNFFEEGGGGGGGTKSIVMLIIFVCRQAFREVKVLKSVEESQNSKYCG